MRLFCELQFVLSFANTQISQVDEEQSTQTEGSDIFESQSCTDRVDSGYKSNVNKTVENTVKI